MEFVGDGVISHRRFLVLYQCFVLVPWLTAVGLPADRCTCSRLSTNSWWLTATQIGARLSKLTVPWASCQQRVKQGSACNTEAYRIYIEMGQFHHGLMPRKGLCMPFSVSVSPPLSVCLSVCLPACLSVCLGLSLSESLNLSLILFLPLSLPPSPTPLSLHKVLQWPTRVGTRNKNTTITTNRQLTKKLRERMRGICVSQCVCVGGGGEGGGRKGRKTTRWWWRWNNSSRREREWGRQTDKQRQRDWDRDWDRQRQGQTETDRDRDTQRETEREREKERDLRERDRDRERVKKRVRLLCVCVCAFFSFLFSSFQSISWKYLARNHIYPYDA